MIIIMIDSNNIMNIKLKLNKSNKNINIIVLYKNSILFTVSSNQIKLKNKNILKQILIEKLSEIGIKNINVLKNELKYLNK